MHEPAIVEIVDPTPMLGGVLAPQHVLVNGTDVGIIAENGIVISPGSREELTTVTLTLLPRQIIIRHDADEQVISDGAGRQIKTVSA